jgi:CBS domain-containing protein
MSFCFALRSSLFPLAFAIGIAATVVMILIRALPWSMQEPKVKDWEVQTMPTKVTDILQQKGYDVVTVTSGQTIESVVAVLTENRIGATPVLDDQGAMVGIVSERDVIRGMAQQGAAVLRLSAEQLMTREVKTCSPSDAVVELMETMTNRRIRHLPVIENGSLRGIVSIGDVVKQRLAEAQFELEELRKYVLSS